MATFSIKAEFVQVSQDNIVRQHFFVIPCYGSFTRVGTMLHVGFHIIILHMVPHLVCHKDSFGLIKIVFE